MSDRQISRRILLGGMAAVGVGGLSAMAEVVSGSKLESIPVESLRFDRSRVITPKFPEDIYVPPDRWSDEDRSFYGMNLGEFMVIESCREEQSILGSLLFRSHNRIGWVPIQYTTSIVNRNGTRELHCMSAPCNLDPFERSSGFPSNRVLITDRPWTDLRCSSIANDFHNAILLIAILALGNKPQRFVCYTNSDTARIMRESRDAKKIDSIASYDGSLEGICEVRIHDGGAMDRQNRFVPHIADSDVLIFDRADEANGITKFRPSPRFDDGCRSYASACTNMPLLVMKVR